MDGAALYDMANKRYLYTCPLPTDAVLRCEAVFRERRVHCFLNGVLDDNLMIYYGSSTTTWSGRALKSCGRPHTEIM